MQKSDGFSNMDPLFLCDHWGLIYRQSLEHTQAPKFKKSGKGCNARNSTQENQGFSNVYPPFLAIIGRGSDVQNYRDRL